MGEAINPSSARNIKFKFFFFFLGDKSSKMNFVLEIHTSHGPLCFAYLYLEKSETWRKFFKYYFFFLFICLNNSRTNVWKRFILVKKCLYFQNEISIIILWKNRHNQTGVSRKIFCLLIILF